MVKKSKKLAAVCTSQSISQAFKAILESNFEYLMEWQDAARSWDDIEGVHQVRVSFRRMRSALSAFRWAIPRQLTRDWSEEMRWLAGQLGMARDLDVFITEGLRIIEGRLPLTGEDKMLALAERHREAAYETVRAMLESERYLRFREAFPVWVAEEGWLSAEMDPKHRNRAALDVVPFARRLLDKLERRVLEAGAHGDPNSATDMHKLRIQCKKLRYAAEFFLPIFAGMEEFLGHMKGLQDLLGVMNDVSVMKRLVETLLEGQRDLEVVEYAGGLVGWRARQYYEVKDSFETRWEELVQVKHPWWKKSALIA
jgi:CHAD domain-containing protein